MVIGVIIGVIIGLVLIYSLLSVLVTQINTLITNALKTRTRHLRHGIEELLRGDLGLQDDLLRHPLVRVETLEPENIVMVLAKGIREMLRRIYRPMLKAVAKSDAAKQPGTMAQSVAGRVTRQETPLLTNVTWVDAKMFSEALVYLLIRRAEKEYFDRLYDFTEKIDRQKFRKEREEVRDLICRLQNNAEGVTVETVREKLLPLIDALGTSSSTTISIKVERESGSSGSAAVAGAVAGAVLGALPGRTAEMRAAEDGELTVVEILNNLSDAREAVFRYNQNRELATLMVGIAKLPPSPAKETLLILVSSANNTENARKRLEQWFDAQMERTSELYKRKMGVYSAIIGLALALALNADTIQMARALWESDDLRAISRTVAEQLVAQMESGAASAPDVPTSVPDSFLIMPDETPVPSEFSGGVPGGAGFAAQTESTAESTEAPIPEITPTPMPRTADEVLETLGQLSEQGLPIGWYVYPRTVIDCGLAYVDPTPLAAAQAGTEIAPTPEPTPTPSRPPECDDKRNIALFLPSLFDPDRDKFDLGRYDFGGLLAKLMGIALTTIAIAQGAPFWFAILQRLVSGGKKEENTTINVNVPPRTGG